MIGRNATLWEFRARDKWNGMDMDTGPRKRMEWNGLQHYGSGMLHETNARVDSWNGTKFRNGMWSLDEMNEMRSNPTNGRKFLQVLPSKCGGSPGKIRNEEKSKNRHREVTPNIASQPLGWRLLSRRNFV